MYIVVVKDSFKECFPAVEFYIEHLGLYIKNVLSQ